MAPDSFFVSISDKQLAFVAGADLRQQVVHTLLVEFFKHIVEQQQEIATMKRILGEQTGRH